jgi:hypothetical protein
MALLFLGLYGGSLAGLASTHGAGRTGVRRVTGQPTTTIVAAAKTAGRIHLRPAVPVATLLPVSTSRTRPILTDADSTNTQDWKCIRDKESGDDYWISGDEPNGGVYQIAPATWAYLGYGGTPNTSPAWVQDEAALKLWHWDARYTYSPWSAWQTAPECGL